MEKQFKTDFLMKYSEDLAQKYSLMIKHPKLKILN